MPPTRTFPYVCVGGRAGCCLNWVIEFCPPKLPLSLHEEQHPSFAFSIKLFTKGQRNISREGWSINVGASSPTAPQRAEVCSRQRGGRTAQPRGMRGAEAASLPCSDRQNLSHMCFMPIVSLAQNYEAAPRGYNQLVARN